MEVSKSRGNGLILLSRIRLCGISDELALVDSAACSAHATSIANTLCHVLSKREPCQRLANADLFVGTLIVPLAGDLQSVTQYPSICSRTFEQATDERAGVSGVDRVSRKRQDFNH